METRITHFVITEDMGELMSTTLMNKKTTVHTHKKNFRSFFSASANRCVCVFYLTVNLFITVKKFGGNADGQKK